MRTLYERTRSRPTLSVLAIALVAGLAASPAIGDEDDDAEARLQSYTVKLKEQEVADKRNAATSELGKAQALIDKSRTLSEKRSDREELARTLDELQATLELSAARIVHADARAQLDAQKVEMEEVQKQLTKTKAAADDAEKKQAEIAGKIGGGK
jgi:hypothetical protein